MQSNYLPVEVQSIIISKLGKSNLLNARLVCSSWNQECLGRLRNSNFTQKLNLIDGDVFQRYLEFASTRKSPQLVLPFRLVIKNNVGSNEKINSLLKLFGPDCVQTVVAYISWRNDIQEKLTFLRVLSTLSSSLNKLYLTCSDDMNENEETTISDAIAHLNFPNLKSMKISGWPTSVGGFYENLLRKCPNLEKLSTNILGENWTLNFEVLKKFSFPHFAAPMITGNIEHAFPLTPVLQDLCIPLSQNEIQFFKDLLSRLSKTLRSLEIILCSLEEWPTTLVFPQLPNLRRLKIDFADLRYPIIFLNPQTMNFNPWTFPMLKFLHLPFRCIFNPNISSDLIFPNIQILSLEEPVKVSYRCNTLDANMGENIRNNFELLGTMLPNIKKVALSQKYILQSEKREERRKQMKANLKGFFESNLAQKVEIIEFQCCSWSLMEQVLRHIEHPPQIMINYSGRNLEFEMKLMDALSNLIGSFSITAEATQVSNQQGFSNTQGIIIQESPAAMRCANNLTRVKKLELKQCSLECMDSMDLDDKNHLLHSLPKCCTQNELPSIQLYDLIRHFPYLSEIEMISGEGARIFADEINQLKKDFNFSFIES